MSYSTYSSYSCSKLFSGGLPELTNEILNYLHDDYSTLYSCVLVNRLWCRLAVPILWRDPFSISTYKKHLSHHFIDFYLYYLDDDDKNVFREEFGINRIDFLLTTPLFNYPSFIKALNTYKLDLIVSDWIDSFTEQPSNSKSHRKKGNSLNYNLPQPTMLYHPTRLRQYRPPSFHFNNDTRNSSPFESPPPSGGNIRDDFQKNILPPPLITTSLQRKYRGSWDTLPFPLPVDFKYLKQETPLMMDTSLPIRPINPTFSTQPIVQPRRRRIRRRIPFNLLNVRTVQLASLIPPDEKLQDSIKLRHFICRTLIKLFISNFASLITFEIIVDRKTTLYDFKFIHEVYELIKDSPKFISGVENFTFHHNPTSQYFIMNGITATSMDSILPFTSYLPSLCNSVKDLKIQVQPFQPNNVSLKASKNLARFIDSQKALSKLTFAFNKDFLQDSLSTLKSVASTLTCLIFDSCHFINIQSFQSLECLENLESLQFYQCYPVLKLELVQHLSNISNLKIKTLAIVTNDSQFIDPSDDVLQYQLIFHKVGSHLENLILSIYDKRNIFDSISHYCEKIKFIHFTEIQHEHIPRLNDLLSCFGTTLRYLTLDIKYDFNHYPRFSFRRLIRIEDEHSQSASTLLLQQLGQALPLTLEYIDLFLILDPINLQTFLDNCKHLKLKRFLLRNMREFYLDDTLQLLKRLIMDMNSIQCLAYRIGKGVDSFEWDLGGNGFRERKEAKEFEPYVKVKKYSEAVIRMSEPFNLETFTTYTL
ncbi:3301_t:CDS:1 [Funneliformis mosseae]|uniref:3301_t:CDS:1 n=1 Tax=Funneliformis mosseae TaxID=27381 RepID=A0A9N9F3N2_FUNMO|nr:3301_t:CDS:1 [Funneliformis mosseae]